jgi:hypothetical protein
MPQHGWQFYVCNQPEPFNNEQLNLNNILMMKDVRYVAWGEFEKHKADAANKGIIAMAAVMTAEIQQRSQQQCVPDSQA